MQYSRIFVCDKSVGADSAEAILHASSAPTSSAGASPPTRPPRSRSIRRSPSHRRPTPTAGSSTSSPPSARRWPMPGSASWRRAGAPPVSWTPPGTGRRGEPGDRVLLRQQPRSRSGHPAGDPQRRLVLGDHRRPARLHRPHRARPRRPGPDDRVHPAGLDLPGEAAAVRRDGGRPPRCGLLAGVLLGRQRSALRHRLRRPDREPAHPSRCPGRAPDHRRDPQCSRVDVEPAADRASFSTVHPDTEDVWLYLVDPNGAVADPTPSDVDHVESPRPTSSSSSTGRSPAAGCWSRSGPGRQAGVSPAPTPVQGADRVSSPSLDNRGRKPEQRRDHLLRVMAGRPGSTRLGRSVGLPVER
jgi:hypothetical protein